MYRLNPTLFEYRLTTPRCQYLKKKVSTEETLEHTDKEQCIKAGCTVVCLSARK